MNESADQRPEHKNHYFAIVALFVLVSGALVFYSMRPPMSDACSSETLAQGRGHKLDFSAKTLTMSSNAEPVSIETLPESSTQLFDQMTRLCRMHKDGSITDEQYEEQMDNYWKTIRLMVGNVSASALPNFKGAIDLMGSESQDDEYARNKSFMEFLRSNTGKVVFLEVLAQGNFLGALPAGMISLEDAMIDKCYGGDLGGRFNAGDGGRNVFNTAYAFASIEMSESEMYSSVESNAVLDDLYCGATITFQSDREMSWSHFGTGLNSATVSGFFRIEYQGIGASPGKYVLIEVEGDPSDFAAVQSDP